MYRATMFENRNARKLNPSHRTRFFTELRGTREFVALVNTYTEPTTKRAKNNTIDPKTETRKDYSTSTSKPC